MSNLDSLGVSAAAKADAAAALATMTVDLSRRERERAVEIVLHHVAVAGSPADGNPHRRDAERLRALNPPLLEAAADADKRADEWDATFAAGLAAGRAEASPAYERLREALERANDDLILIADESPEGVGESIDSVRAAIKDALAAADREKPEE